MDKQPEELISLYRKLEEVKSHQKQKNHTSDSIQAVQTSIGMTERLGMARIEVTTFVRQYHKILSLCRISILVKVVSKTMKIKWVDY